MTKKRALTAAEMLDHRVSFPTVSRDSNLDLIAFVEGVPAIHVAAQQVTYIAAG